MRDRPRGTVSSLPAANERNQARLFWLSTLVGLVGPWWVTSVAGVNEFVDWPSAPAPFGFHSIAVAQLVLAGPLCWWMACLLYAAIGKNRHVMVALISMVIGTAALLGYQAATHDQWFQFDAWHVRASARLGIAVGLTLPWVIASRMLLEHCPPGLAWEAKASQLPPLLLLGTIPVLCYSSHLYQQQLQRAKTLADQQQLASSMGIVQCLLRIDSTGTMSVPGGSSTNVAALSNSLGRRIELAAAQWSEAQQSLPNAEGPEADRLRLVMAEQLAALGQQESAVAVLEDTPTRNLPAAQLMARILQQLKRYDESNEWIASTIKRLGDSNGDENRRFRLQLALAENYRKQLAYQDAQQLLLELTQQTSLSPPQRARAQLELARFYRDTGRPFAARQAFHQAQAEQDTREQATFELQDMSNYTPTCFW